MYKYDIIFSAHDSKKMELAEIIRKYRQGLSAFSVAATASTAQYIRQTTLLSVGLLNDGASGGYLQIAKLVEKEDVRMVVFLFDPASMHLDELGVKILLKSCAVSNIPLANNKTTAEFILERFFEKQLVIQSRYPEMAVVN